MFYSLHLSTLYVTWFLYFLFSLTDAFVAIHEPFSRVKGNNYVLNWQKHVSVVFVWVSTRDKTAQKNAAADSDMPGNSCAGLHGENTDAKKHPEILIRWLLIKKTDKRQGWAPEDQREIY